MAEHIGWLLDVYADPQDDLVLWLLDEDGTRRRLHHPFPVTFYAAGPAPRLRSLWRFLETLPWPLTLERTERRDLFQAQPVCVLAVTVHQPARLSSVFRAAEQRFPELTYYDADIPLALRYAAVSVSFPLARCRVNVDGDRLLALEPLDTPWDLDVHLPPLRTLSVRPNVDPSHAPPTHLLLRAECRRYRLSLQQPARPLLVIFKSLLLEHDPDLLLTTWGDTWLLPLLISLSQRHRIPLPLNREARRGVVYRPERTYHTYGQVMYRGQQVHLFGRWHVDRANAVMYHDYEMLGVLEMARVTGLPVQTAARVSPGTGVSASQILAALRLGILVPYSKRQTEHPKTALDLIGADQGGLVYQPLIGVHRDVAEIDFVSLYPSLMVRDNISPETTPFDIQQGEDNLPGLIPQTLAPILQKRIALKVRMGKLSRRDLRYRQDKARASALKWLLVTCFGYLGYKNARFGRIEAHEAVTAHARQALLTAKEAAEDLGYTVLHMYVDGLWVHKPGVNTPQAVQPLLDEICKRTGLPIALDGIYRWIAFLPSRMDARVPVANRYYGVFQDGTIKMRGIEARRRDTPKWIAQIQEKLLQLLASAPDASALPSCLPAALRILRQHLADLEAGRVPLEALLVRQKVSRQLEEYRQPSPAARAAAQLAKMGKAIKPGQRVPFVYIRSEPGVWAWDLPQPPDPRLVDRSRYRNLLLRAASTVLYPLGLSEPALRKALVGQQCWTTLFARLSLNHQDQLRC